ncbi:hypothetical protein ESA94_05235 [Lacibacter luteus]|uniref:Uncharacterized protein n=1 Tax=Lacibacter luteus TaxID=2508719 RepID=A0A4Q1CMX1_9BACT|nr:hypothetical protein [Lacibacter luteus]RXK62413.1 hypothetical protein ESA94_05235 [Lacibacter luteus]
MIDSELVKQHYLSLSDEELTSFALKEKKNITAEALTILKKVFEERKLNFPDLPGRNAASDQYEIQKREQWKLKNDLWIEALRLRKNGKSDEEVMSFLLSKGLTNYEIEKLMEHLPVADYNDEEFNKFIVSSSEKASLSTLFALLVLAVLLFFIINSALKFPVFFIPAGVILIAIIYFLRKFKGDLKGGYYWQTVLHEEPERIVWIKPIIEKHTLVLVITLFKVGKFQFLTSDGLQKTITCDSDENRSVFFRGIRYYVPHAHIGYNEQVDQIYQDDPASFLKSLQQKGLYQSVSELIKKSSV